MTETEGETPETEVNNDVDAGTAGVNNDVESAEQADLEGRARRMGWRPKEEFRGDQSRWTDAKTFIERGETELPILRERFRALDDRAARSETQVGSLQRDNAELKQRIEQLGTTMQEQLSYSRRADERAYSRARAELESRMAQAVETADKEGYNRAKAELDALGERPAPAAAAPLKKDPEQPPTQTAPPVDPAVSGWVAENPWFQTDRDMNAFATSYHGYLLQAKPGLSIRENLDMVRSKVMAEFPDKFGNAPPPPRRAGAAAVVDPRPSPPPRKTGRTVNDLPPDAKAALARFKRDIPGFTDDDYLKTYDWS